MTPLTRQDLLHRLAELGIDYVLHEHPPLRTVEQSKALRGELPGGHIKNLFLRDKKRNMWLVTVLEDRPIDLKALRSRIDARGTLSFGNAELLREALGVEPGAVTPCALVNDPDRRVTFVLDKAVLAHDPVNAHPLTNDATIALAPDDLLRFVAACGHEAMMLDFDQAV
ncbi:MAG: prolyl-tRNA synthetase associated domain-containing protein [Alphaproteobacteria bacterium]|nr:prolyl-tRNA synthetase associated domain-containing protein [Alphaproteobacteria bacterium]